MKKITLLVSILTIGQLLFSQDTLTVLQYNLLNYGNTTDYCTPDNNNISDKDQYIRTIIKYVKPDIFTVNEISESLAIQKHMIEYNLNVDGVDYYKQANFIKVANSYIVNALYYNSQKIILHSHTIAQSYIRDIDVYKLYYRSDDLIEGDTAFLICVVAHLKSSSSGDNPEKRRAMVYNAMTYLDSYSEEANYLFMGDFNVYSSSEPAYQLLTSNSDFELMFYDPINTSGSWHNNDAYQNIHTQSTHSGSNGCAASGGMDDRFDFILCNDNVMDGNKDIQYIDDSYEAIGQDGLHFNKSIIDAPENESAPMEVIEALYGNSDHLPITLKLAVNKTLGISAKQHTLFNEILFENPISDNLYMVISSKESTVLTLDILNISGVNILEYQVKTLMGKNHIAININNISPGVYFAVFTDGENGRVVKKIVVY